MRRGASYIGYCQLGAAGAEGHEACFKKDNEVNKHLQEAKTAAKAGDANAMQEALAKAADDLEELAECLGLEILPG